MPNERLVVGRAEDLHGDPEKRILFEQNAAFVMNALPPWIKNNLQTPYSRN